MDIISEVKSLSLPSDSYAVLGSSILAIHGIREANDIDMIVSPGLFDMLRKSGWTEETQESGRLGLAKGHFFVMTNWPTNWPPDEEGRVLEEFKPHIETRNGIPFLSLSFMRDWKAQVGRPKDLEDVVLIDRYLETHASI